MNKFKVGDKVVVVEGDAWVHVGTECVIEEGWTFNRNEGEGSCTITGGNVDQEGDTVIGNSWFLYGGQLKLISKAKGKDQKQLPLCYAEEQENSKKEFACKVVEIHDSLFPDLFGDNDGCAYSGGEFHINAKFNITQAKALKKWLTKMTATPKKPVKKVTKKKPSKKKDLLKLSRK